MLRTLRHSFFALLVHLRRGDIGMLRTVRLLALFCAASTLLACVALSSQPLPKTKCDYTSNTGTSENSNQNQNPKSRWERIWERTWDDPIALYTFVLAVFTGVLGTVSVIQIAFLIRADKTARIAADAAVKSVMPVLSPYIIEMNNLHQVYQIHTTVPLNSSIHFIFENYGKTVGIVRQLRADLLLIDRDKLPKIDFERLPILPAQPMVPGGMRRESSTEAGIECKKSSTITPEGLNELFAEAATGKFKRFYLIGLVIYDDFFGVRHTRRFCVKMRLFSMAMRNFQNPEGGIAYNRITREKIPKNDPLEKVGEPGLPPAS